MIMNTRLIYELDRFGAKTQVTMTKAEAKRLARLARSYGHWSSMNARLDEYVCPMVSVIYPGRSGDGVPRHRVGVHHFPWETPRAAQVDAVIIEHLTGEAYSDGSGRCPYVREAQK